MFLQINNMSMKKNLIISFILLLLTTTPIIAQNATSYILKENIPYIGSSEKDEYRKERCKLDFYYPENTNSYPTVVWFHGGGLEGGNKHIPEELKNKGIAVVAVNYRLSPKAQNPAYIEDAAAAVAWVFHHIKSYGGDPAQIFVSGHSAGGYLALMIGLDKSYLNKYNIDTDQIRGLIPISGQTNTHYTIRKERGIPMEIPVIDAYAPINQSRKDIPPTLLVTGDRNLEMTARYEENAHLEVILKSLGNKNVKLYELQGFDHGSVYTPGCLLILDWVKKWKVENEK